MHAGDKLGCRCLQSSALGHNARADQPGRRPRRLCALRYHRRRHLSRPSDSGDDCKLDTHRLRRWLADTAARQNSDFKITVQDRLNDTTQLTATSIHWHGLRQRNSSWADGVAMVSQCPIVPGVLRPCVSCTVLKCSFFVQATNSPTLSTLRVRLEPICFTVTIVRNTVTAYAALW
jgi:hypothetical protein